MLRTSLALLLLVLLTGCKLAVIVVEGGEIQSVASGTCTPVSSSNGAVCIHEITGTNYTETFTAIPNPGWEFLEWQEGNGFVCSFELGPECTVSNVGFTGSAAAESVVASNKTFYLMPVFQLVTGDPITDTLVRDGKEWAQVDLFYGVTWDEVNSLCSSGICEAGILNGFDVSGWTWASVSDINQLFSSYIGSSELVTSAGSYYSDSRDLASSFFSDGWRNDSSTSVVSDTYGWISDTPVEGPASVAVVIRRELNVPIPGSNFTTALSGVNLPDLVSVGAWFYRIP